LILWKDTNPWIEHKGQIDFTVLKITDGAYSEENNTLIKKYLSCMRNENQNVRTVLLLALFCILESISFTRKDGQYLRWDQRSGRCLGAIPFNKGEIQHFNNAIKEKLAEILADIKDQNSYSLFDFSDPTIKKGNITIIGGSCLNELPIIGENCIDLVITSPPYCNRYDYTRTYALELAMLGIDEKKLVALRQDMLSCTVENREKDLLAINPAWANALSICKNHELLQNILKYLYTKKEKKTLNNNGIPRMVKGYFYEMACVIYELYRVLTSGGEVVMVNDNVRYAGASISVDLILSDIAAKIGFEIEEIAVLPIGKGNSSQQMGEHGREPLRKCVYIWRKR
jgi:DNA modification methylase